jgi:drug/metabolite transporter, DME family
MSDVQHPVKGVALAVLSAVAYTLTNMALRQAAGRDDFGWAMWVTAHKAVPAALVAWAIIGWRAWRGLPALPPREFVLPLIGTGIVIQFVGNMSFQLGLSFGGLALTVALTFSTLIISSALLSRALLGEGIGVQTAASMVLMIAAVALLSFGAQSATHPAIVFRNHWTGMLAVVCGCTAGCGYGLAGVTIRKAVGAQLSLSATVVLMSSTGVVGMGLPGLLTLGPREAFSMPIMLRGTLLLGGVMNAIAFFSVSGALRYLEVVRVNLVNSSQVAMAALAGILLFGEDLTLWLGAGIALTIVGLAVMGLRPARADVGLDAGDGSEHSPATAELPASAEVGRHD